MNTLFLNSSQYDLARQLEACQSTRRRRGKVARLPFALRQQINLMLDDGVPYKTIIQKLGDAGKHLSEDNIGNWRTGGYQDYLKAQIICDRARSQTEAATELLRESGPVSSAQIKEACSQVALLAYLDSLIKSGKILARNTFKKNPGKMLTLMNTVCNLANTGLQFDKQKNLLLEGSDNEGKTL
jgi:hypothetical protein